ncbi:MAG: hypothetical protein ACNA7J_11480, partial [Wenzhouxiangella sp.]
HFAWNGENRMVAATNGSTVVSNTYDSQGRRVRKQVVENGTPAIEISYLYDGWNLIAEYADEGGAFVGNYYTWGLDLSQSLQGAGGVGGMLVVAKDCQRALKLPTERALQLPYLLKRRFAGYTVIPKEGVQHVEHEESVRNKLDYNALWRRLDPASDRPRTRCRSQDHPPLHPPGPPAGPGGRLRRR